MVVIVFEENFQKYVTDIFVYKPKLLFKVKRQGVKAVFRDAHF